MKRNKNIVMFETKELPVPFGMKYQIKYCHHVYLFEKKKELPSYIDQNIS